MENSPTYRFGCYLILLLCSWNFIIAQTATIKGQIINSSSEQKMEGVRILINENQAFQESDSQGEFSFFNLEKGTYTLSFFNEGFNTKKQTIQLEEGQNLYLNISLDSLQLQLKTFDVDGKKNKNFGLNRLRNVEGVAIYAAKKSEVIQLENSMANLAINNAREVYKGVAGLNIWESDGAGLQLSIGARGLDPNRTSNFNTRQNGYDISADALGYPESYFTPPTLALERIEIVRGAASLQYGPQFGGLLNFKLKKGSEDHLIQGNQSITYGSFGLINSFSSLGGSTDTGWNYYGFYQYKKGDGWRENSNFNQHTAYASLYKTSLNGRLKMGLEFTHMNYLAKQAGGLQDFEFEQNPQQSNRDRNWFEVNWNLTAFQVDYKLNENTKLNSRTFVLDATRKALGELGPINRPDPLRERDLIVGSYLNFGNETRIISNYQLGTLPSTFIIGARYYQGLTKNQQGNASDGADADFSFLNPDNLEKSDYKFPSRNFSLFAEHLFNLPKGWSITPGLRLEYIKTASDGFYKEDFIVGGQVLDIDTIFDSKSRKRALLLAGIGLSKKLNNSIELYSNFSQNYRSINFSDLAIVNPNLIVDSLLTDEKGFNTDIGIRGRLKNGALRFDATAFYLRYRNRIGTTEIVVPDPVVIEKAIAFRTNIGDAQIYGLEAYIESDLLRWFSAFENKKQAKSWSTSLFINASLLKGKYIKGTSDINGNEVELIPPLSIKTGFVLAWKSLRLSYQLSYVEQHFTDATNAVFVSNATIGLVPDYFVQDCSISCSYKFLKVQGGVNNLANASYFTRRATAYPGPGIIPSDGRSFYASIGLTYPWK